MCSPPAVLQRSPSSLSPTAKRGAAGLLVAAGTARRLQGRQSRRLHRHIAKGMKREDEETKAGGVVLHKVFLTIFKIVKGSEMWHEEEKTYPKSVMFENKAGKQTRVFIQA